ncbi:transporter substrate-binding domain-containing protein [Streptococcus sobrinus]|uniref:ABC transporter, substrate-binding protein, family 3 n=2 Tax=Streptococcus sobrinus TaxID=1310 RepID=U2IK57_9STRE|nr:transporter substrate-binding domain-containing protein [Streptococcus sobrinus]AWN20834.1 amino acid ABC transporter substrate-binding protein [Streptococcus sobrinus]EMP71483.1 amino acid ABC transporter substrate binding protein [Streptococcus sobrinus DSM 20742 = ATCC 33478]ERJ74286.1 ABC transporter, substrate-binding protein, family 3 [Streptococcus sobrinus W1703]SQG13609.1 polar amino acid transport system substrate-binding protein [Streptococcus sobrinus]
MTNKKKWTIAISVLVVLALALGLVFFNGSKHKQGTKQTVVTVATSGSPKPFTYVDGRDQLTGQNIELLKAVFKKLPQYKLKLEKTEFDSIFSGLNSGRYQMGVNNIAKNPERQKNYLFSDPMFKNSYVVIYKSDNKEAKQADSWDDLAGHSTVGSTGVNTSTAIEKFNKKHPDKKIDLNYSEEDLTTQLQGVESGKYDFLLMDKPMFEYYQKELGLKLTGKPVSGDLEKELLSEPYSYFVFSKDQKQLQKDVNKALKEVTGDGTSKKINEKYFGEDYSPSYK